MDSLLPSLPALLILSILADAPAHGYEIAQKVGDRSGGVLDLKEGTLYPRLYQLERQGMVVAEWRQESGRRVRVYALTEAGAGRLEREHEAWQRRVAAAQRVLTAKAVPRGGEGSHWRSMSTWSAPPPTSR